MSIRVWFLVLLFPLRQFATPLTQLTMSSDPTDYIGQGKNYFYDLTNTTSFDVYTYDYNGDGQPNTIFIQIFTPTENWELTFGTNDSSVDLTAGYYPNAGTYPPGHAFMTVFGDGRGDSVTGSFTVLYSFFPRVTQKALAPPGSSFAITFTQTCCGNPTGPVLNGNLYGTLYYNYDPAATPEPRFGSLAGCGLVAFLLGCRFFAKGPC
jgi:hypothetical protein